MRLKYQGEMEIRNHDEGKEKRGRSKSEQSEVFRRLKTSSEAKRRFITEKDLNQNIHAVRLC